MASTMKGSDSGLRIVSAEGALAITHFRERLHVLRHGFHSVHALCDDAGRAFMRRRAAADRQPCQPCQQNQWDGSA